MAESDTDADVSPVQFETVETSYESRTLSTEFQSLFFDPALNGVQLPKQSIDYEIRDGGDSLRMGPWELKGEDIAISLSQEKAEFWELDFGLQYRTRSRGIYFLSFRWPLKYLTTGQLEMLDDQSKVIWAKEITDKDLEEWDTFLKKENLTTAPTVLSGATQKETDLLKNVAAISKVHRNSQIGYIGRDLLAIPLWRIKKPFRFCITQDFEDGRRAICSRRYRFAREAGQYRLRVESSMVRPRVMVNNRAVSLKGSAIFADEKSPMRFVSMLSSGTYIEFISSPKDVNILDVVKSNDGHFIEAIGYGHTPMGEVQLLDAQHRDLWSFLNFMPTIGDQRQLWRTRVPFENPYIYFKGHGGVPFRQALLFEDLPSEKARPQINRFANQSTYKSRPVLKGKVDPSVQVRSEQESVQRTGADTFEWTYRANESGEVNRSILYLKEGSNEWKAYHEMFRSYPRELALRMTGVLSNEMEMVFMGEVAGQWWLESLFGWENPTFSYQRWGVAARYFQAFTSTGNKNGTSLIKFQVSNLDLKYRLTPGVWGHDPTIGLMLNAQSMVFENFEAQMAGGGIFWARSMPQFLDKMISWIPGFNFPKWVDTEFIYYPVPLSPQTQLGPNMAVNFHGKIQWGRQFYGEAGFGLKSFVISDLKVRKKVGLGVAYGTVGLGYNF